MNLQCESDNLQNFFSVIHWALRVWVVCARWRSQVFMPPQVFTALSELTRKTPKWWREGGSWGLGWENWLQQRLRISNNNKAVNSNFPRSFPHSAIFLRRSSTSCSTFSAFLPLPSWHTRGLLWQRFSCRQTRNCRRNHSLWIYWPHG